MIEKAEVWHLELGKEMIIVNKCLKDGSLALAGVAQLVGASSHTPKGSQFVGLCHSSPGKLTRVMEIHSEHTGP